MMQRRPMLNEPRAGTEGDHAIAHHIERSAQRPRRGKSTDSKIYVEPPPVVRVLALRVSIQKRATPPDNEGAVVNRQDAETPREKGR
jgi:hypothetical protein